MRYFLLPNVAQEITCTEVYLDADYFVLRDVMLVSLANGPAIVYLEPETQPESDSTTSPPDAVELNVHEVIVSVPIVKVNLECECITLPCLLGISG